MSSHPDQGPARLMLLAFTLAAALATAVAAGPIVLALAFLGLCTGAGARVAHHHRNQAPPGRRDR